MSSAKTKTESLIRIVIQRSACRQPTVGSHEISAVLLKGFLGNDLPLKVTNRAAVVPISRSLNIGTCNV